MISKSTVHRVIYRVHLYLGITLGFTLGLLCLSGSLLLLLETTTSTLSVQETEAIPESKSIRSIPEAIKKFSTQFPETPIRNIFPPGAPGEPVRIETAEPNKTYFVNSGPEPIRVHNPGSTLAGCLRTFHTSLGMAAVGRVIVGIHGIILLVFLGTGIVLWSPGKRRFRRALISSFKLNSINWRSVHIVLGVLALPTLFLASSTGLTLAFSTTVNRLASRFSTTPTISKFTPLETKKPLSDLLFSAGQTLPGTSTTRLTLPLKPEDPLIIRKRYSDELHPNGMSFVYLNPYTGELLGVRDARSAGSFLTLINSRFPIHIGAYRMGAFLHIVSGMVPLFLWLSGFIMWYQKVRRGWTIHI